MTLVVAELAYKHSITTKLDSSNTIIGKYV
ncbi:hypothetical protein AAS21_gp077 [Pantoea phage vB_PagS_AAS21]|uniref:Uncharacterized protein n=1 Tax=Pantoea phage vB_PagS_AAS21 TaxID=2575261 RepID=A0A4Y5P1K1_9CAUD|nr:hypothetical protein AAS21_gp077 [Pantoea phage vB_PagS_AAS21]